jgi:tetratricopeptide (TPR) repeat protein
MAYSRHKARELWQEIEGLDREWQRRRLARATPRWAMVGLLAEESIRLAASDWKAALETADLALLVARRLEIMRPSQLIPEDADEIPLDESAQLEALGLAYAARGNAYRVDERYVEAQEQFAMLESLGISTPALGYHPRSLSLQASLYCELHHFQEALETLTIAQELVRGGSPAGEGFLAILGTQEALTRMYKGDLEGARRIGRRLLADFPPRIHRSRAMLVAVANYVDILSRIPRLQEAEDQLEVLQELCEEFGSPSDHLRIAWTQARIAYESGDLERALRLFQAVAAEWLEMGHGYKWSLLNLEIALVHLALNEPGRIRELAKVSLPVLAAHGASVDVQAVFKTLAHAEELDQVFLRSLLRKLETLPQKRRMRLG